MLLFTVSIIVFSMKGQEIMKNAQKKLQLSEVELFK